MNRRIDKILGTLIYILVIGLLSGCRQEPASTQNSSQNAQTQASPTAQVESSTSDEFAPEAVSTPTRANNMTPASVISGTNPTVILVANQINTLDPYQMVTINPEGSVASHIWDTVTRLNDNLAVEPHLAESWRLINNFTWEFKLRQGVQFHDGEMFNAEAVRFSIERARSLPGSLETFASDVNLTEVKIVDDYTIRLTTGQPVANLPFYLSFLEILPPQYYSENNPAILATTPVGSGPYQVKSWQQGEPVVLEAFADYWQGMPKLPRLVFETVPSATERLNALQQGQAALITDLPSTSANQFEPADGNSIKSIESTQRLFVGIRLKAGSPLEDKKVRQALNYGVNVNQLVDDLLAGYGERYGSWVIPPANNTDLAPWPYDPELARQLLTEAGYSTGFTTTLRTPVGVYDHDVEIAQAMAQQLKEIGVTVEVEAINNWDVYVHTLLNDQADYLFLLGLNSRGDALQDVSSLSVDFPFNPTGWQNDSFEEILTGAVNTFNENSRARLLKEAQAIAYDEAPWIWLWRPYYFYGLGQNLDWSPRPDGLINLYEPAGVPDENAE